MAIVTRHPNTQHRVNDTDGTIVETTDTWNLGHGEMMELSLAMQDRDDTGKLNEHVRYLAWLLGQEGVEVTITRKWTA